eukprot:TRINITY_DN93_c0_g1_i1.p1 TRINITY_DN93_c0_g1~~TRINITY_DN93_c0_g1_i1.p1  ORF type:complete len:421 (-),score=100.36 TRINITY_DN93_c0_g1_i1:1060-2322(-)
MLDVSENDLRDQGAVVFGKAFTRNETLEVIKMQDCNIGKKGMVEFIHMLTESSHSHLRELYLDGNPMGDDGGKAIALYLAGEPRIRVLTLRRTHVSSSLKKIVETLKTNKILRQLDIDNLHTLPTQLRLLHADLLKKVSPTRSQVTSESDPDVLESPPICIHENDRLVVRIETFGEHGDPITTDADVKFHSFFVPLDVDEVPDGDPIFFRTVDMGRGIHRFVISGVPQGLYDLHIETEFAEEVGGGPFRFTIKEADVRKATSSVPPFQRAATDGHIGRIRQPLHDEPEPEKSKASFRTVTVEYEVWVNGKVECRNKIRNCRIPEFTFAQLQRTVASEFKVYEGAVLDFRFHHNDTEFCIASQRDFASAFEMVQSDVLSSSGPPKMCLTVLATHVERRQISGVPIGRPSLVRKKTKSKLHE